jgi:hypothetical protein
MNSAISLRWRHFFSRTAQSDAVDIETEIPSFEIIIRDAELLISYAATAGIKLDDSNVKVLLEAYQQYMESGKNIRNVKYTDSIFSSYADVAKQLLPVTASTIRQSSSVSRHVIRYYLFWGFIFVILVLSASLITYVSTTLSDSIKAELEIADSKVLALRAHLATAAGSAQNESPSLTYSTYSELDRIKDLQQFANSIRGIYFRGVQLQHLAFWAGQTDPFRNVSTQQLENVSTVDLTRSDHENFARLIAAYQPIQNYARNLREFVTFWYGGIATSLLPICYALLGASAWMLRQMQISIHDRTFDANVKSGRMLVASIAGTIIGLFNGLLFSSGLSLSPLAWAFIAGYSSDTLFRLLDGVLRIRARNESVAQTVPTQIGGP